jgi:3-phenylpropionate/trans-cinnamate dioxygenase ferredoxin component
MSEDWIKACDAREIEKEDVIRFDYNERTFAIYRTKADEFYATDGLCTHAHVHLADGFVMGNIIECPKHNGQFDFRTGRATRIPACIDLQTYPVKIEGGDVFIKLGGGDEGSS